MRNFFTHTYFKGYNKMSTSLVVLCAGESSRFSLSVKKQWLRISDIPLWLYVTQNLSLYADFEQIIVVGHPDEVKYMENYSLSYKFVAGGNSRQQSIKNALQEVTSSHVMITDVARCCIPKTVINNLLKDKEKANCIVPIVRTPDTVIYNQETINRDQVKLIQTPQLSEVSVLKEALDTDIEYTDESSAIKAINKSVFYVDGSNESRKLTFGDEMKYISCLKAPSSDYFTGTGIDIHQFEPNKQMVLGGVNIQSDVGFKAHSDGDVLIHSIIDALLGACGAGDIGEFFPDTDSKYKNADSKELLKHILKFVKNVGYDIVNVDFTILAQKPKINPHKNIIKQTLSKLLDIPIYRINIKATTGEEMGFVGRKEGIAVISSATLKFHNWMEQ